MTFRTGFITLLVCATYILGASLIDNKRFRRDFNAFNQADLVGPLTSVEPTKIGAAVSVYGKGPQHYVFYPYEDHLLNGGHSFLALARKGDTIQKTAACDTLVLIKGGKRYRYLFKVPGNSFFVPYRLRN